MKLSKGLYAYCIIDREYLDDDRLVQMDGIFPVQYQDISAIVSSTSESSLQPTKKNIMRHQNVVSRMQGSFTVAPLRFGMVFKDKEEVEKLLQDKYADIKKVLHKIRGRVEFGLRLFWHHDAFIEEIGTRKIEDLKKKYQSGNTDRYITAIELGRFIESLINQKREEYIKEIYDPLRDMADESLLNSIIGEKMVFNAAFLVKENLTQQFDDAVNRLQDQYKSKFLFKYSGPWPPYNFVVVEW